MGKFVLYSKIFQIIVASAIISGLVYIAVTGWTTLFPRPGVAVIIAVALAVPCLFLFHRAIQGCWVSWVLAGVFGCLIGAEGGLSLCENLKFAGSARRASLESSAVQATETAGKAAAENEAREAAKSRQEAAEELAAIEAQIAGIALLAPGQEAVLTELASLQADLEAEGKTGMGPSYERKEKALRKREAELGATAAGAAFALESNTAMAARKKTLISEAAGRKAVLALKEARAAKADAALAAASAVTKSVTTETAKLAMTEHTIFKKAAQWAGGDENKELTILFWLGFALMFALNSGAGFWLASVMVPDDRKMKLFVIAEKKKEEPKPENEREGQDRPDNVIDLEMALLTSPKVMTAIAAKTATRDERAKEQFEKAKQMILEDPDIRTAVIAHRLGVSESTARGYRAKCKTAVAA